MLLHNTNKIVSRNDPHVNYIFLFRAYITTNDPNDDVNIVNKYYYRHEWMCNKRNVEIILLLRLYKRSLDLFIASPFPSFKLPVLLMLLLLLEQEKIYTGMTEAEYTQ